MSLNKIQLHPTQLVELYRNSLIEDTESSQKKVTQPALESTMPKIPKSTMDEKIVSEPQEKEWKHLGENKKNILLLVRYANATYLPDEQLNFLVSILAACKLSLGDVAIVNLMNSPAGSYDAVFDHFKSRIIVLFGITPTEFTMPVNFPEFQVQAFNNCTFLYTPMLEKLETDKVLKSKLWVCLRRMFSI